MIHWSLDSGLFTHIGVSEFCRIIYTGYINFTLRYEVVEMDLICQKKFLYRSSEYFPFYY